MKTPHLKTCATLLAVVILQCLNSVGFAQAPVLISPTNYVDSYMRNPVFRWHADSSAQYYKIEIANSSTFNASTIVLTDTVEIPKYVPLNPLHTNTRWWRVQSVYSNGSDSGWSTNGIYYLRDYPNKTNVTTNSTPAEISNAITWARNNPPAKVTFSAGTYRLGIATTNAYLFDISNSRDLCLSGTRVSNSNQTTIIVTNILNGIVWMPRTTNVTIENFDIDYDPLPFTHLKVTAIEPNTNNISLSRVTLSNMQSTITSSNSPINDSRFTDNWYPYGLLMDPKPNMPGKFKDNVHAWGVNLTNNFEVRPNGVSVQVLYGIERFDLNDTYVHLSTGGKASWGFFASRCSNIVFNNVIAYAMSSGFLFFENGSDLNFLSSGFTNRPGRSASSPGGMNCGLNESGPWIEKSVFNGGSDDSIALYSRGIRVVGVVSATNLILTNKSYNLQAGHKFDIFNPSNGSFLAKDCVVISSIAGPNNTFSVTFSNAISNTNLIVATNSSEDANSQVFNKNRVNQHFMIRDNYIGPQRRYGVIIRASKGVVKGNTIVGCSKGGVAFKNEPTKWLNGLDSHDVLVTGNTFINNNYEPDDGADTCADISVAFVALSNSPAAARAHSNIRIVNNAITNWNLRAIAVANGDNILVESNTIGATTNAFLLLGANNAIFATNCTNLIIRTNNFDDKRIVNAKTLVTNCFSVINTNNAEIAWSGLYYIRNKTNNKQIVVSNTLFGNGIPIVQRDSNGYADQRWGAIPISLNRIYLSNSQTFNLLQPAVNGFTNTNVNTPIVTYAFATNRSQQWELIPDGEGYYFIKNSWSGLFLRPTNASASNNAVIVQHSLTNSDSSKWSFIPVD